MSNASLGGYFQRVFDTGGGFEQGFRAIGRLGKVADYQAALGTLSGQSLLALSWVRYNASRAFARSTCGCPGFGDDSTVRTEHG